MTKRSINHEDITVLNVYATKSKSRNYTEQTWAELKENKNPHQRLHQPVTPVTDAQTGQREDAGSNDTIAQLTRH